ncbi:MAG: (R)-hydratase, partial [Amphiplicatus sp.]
QTLSFKAPVLVGDTVKARATVSRLVPEKKFVELATVCSVGDKVVIDGQALIMVSARAALAKAS